MSKAQEVLQIIETREGRVIGSIYADSGGGRGYGGSIEVRYNDKDDTIIVVLSASGPVGGMDTLDIDGTWQEESMRRVIRNPDGKQVLKVIKWMMSGVVRSGVDGGVIIKQSGKPTKNFDWFAKGYRKKGLNAAVIQGAIDAARS